MRAMPPLPVREHNRNAITGYLYGRRHATKQEIERDLGLSQPTITQNLRDLEQAGVVTRGGLMTSTGGRKARAYAFNPRHRTAIGVSMRATEVVMCAVDLYGATVAELRRTLPYRNVAAHYQRVGTLVNDFATGVERTAGPVLGVAFSVRGIVSPDGRSIAFGAIMGNTGLTLDEISQSVRLPCTMVHDADASAMAELWDDPTLTDAVCLYLDRRPSGALIIDGALHPGPGRCNGAIEHMTLVPDGRPCYCGRRGCMDAYCSPETLPEDYESIPGFFSVLEQGETHHRERMDAWLGHVAQAIANARCMVAGDVIIGGEAAQYLDDHDIADLKARVEERCAFGGDFTLRTGRRHDDRDVTGAALHLVDRHLGPIRGGTHA